MVEGDELEDQHLCDKYLIRQPTVTNDEQSATNEDSLSDKYLTR